MYTRCISDSRVIDIPLLKLLSGVADAADGEMGAGDAGKVDERNTASAACQKPKLV